MHHAWLFSGMRGVGKATLAWRAAKAMLAAEHNARVGNASDLPPADGLNVPPDHPIVRRIEALTESALTIVRRGYDPKTGRVFKNIGVEDIRSLGNFFALSSADGLPLIAIIDSADDMNSNAANALLKLLEEPPPNSYLFLVSHSLNGLLPTVRSRCTKLNCVPLGFADLQNALEEAGLSKAAERSALAMLSEGSPGEALRSADQRRAGQLSEADRNHGNRSGYIPQPSAQDGDRVRCSLSRRQIHIGD